MFHGGTSICYGGFKYSTEGLNIPRRCQIFYGGLNNPPRYQLFHEGAEIFHGGVRYSTEV